MKTIIIASLLCLLAGCGKSITAADRTDMIKHRSEWVRQGTAFDMNGGDFPRYLNVHTGELRETDFELEKLPAGPTVTTDR